MAPRTNGQTRASDETRTFVDQISKSPSPKFKGHNWTPADIRARPEDAFSLFDTNQTGSVSVSELLFTTRKTNDEIRKRGSLFEEMVLFSTLDIDGDAVISKDEFCTIVRDEDQISVDALAAIARVASHHELSRREEKKKNGAPRNNDEQLNLRENNHARQQLQPKAYRDAIDEGDVVVKLDAAKPDVVATYYEGRDVEDGGAASDMVANPVQWDSSEGVYAGDECPKPKFKYVTPPPSPPPPKAPSLPFCAIFCCRSDATTTELLSQGICQWDCDSGYDE
ncbi:hypothetical protein CTAYLR_004544 [Chrysophaeum taylorii]|uniref:EF-hand domain-containing protein n=1 Tax=Chrysophaeum taylorii TaxID=2483200 RepID=A0AAD7UNN4_9STRA|nr:hypothetical protein CTAYLR_004544 [Chrysophaeum taylorii]